MFHELTAARAGGLWQKTARPAEITQRRRREGQRKRATGQVRSHASTKRLLHPFLQFCGFALATLRENWTGYTYRCQSAHWQYVAELLHSPCCPSVLLFLLLAGCSPSNSTSAARSRQAPGGREAAAGRGRRSGDCHRGPRIARRMERPNRRRSRSDRGHAKSKSPTPRPCRAMP